MDTLEKGYGLAMRGLRRGGECRMCQLVNAASCGPLSMELQRWHRRLRAAAHVMAAVFSLALAIGERRRLHQPGSVVVRAMVRAPSHQSLPTKAEQGA